MNINVRRYVKYQHNTKDKNIIKCVAAKYHVLRRNFDQRWALFVIHQVVQVLP